MFHHTRSRWLPALVAGAVLSSSLLAASPTTQPPLADRVDWEQQLATQAAAQRAFTYTNNRMAKLASDDPRRIKAMEELAIRFPQSQGAAIHRVRIIQQLGDQAHWTDYLKQTETWLEQFPQWREQQHDVLYDMARRLYKQETPQDVKHRIFMLMLPHLDHRAWLGSYLSNYIAKRDISPLEQYQLAQQVAQHTGPADRIRKMLWQAIARMQQTHPQQANDASARLIEQYGQAHLETSLAQQFILQHTGRAEEAKALQARHRQDARAFKDNFATALKAWANQPPDQAQATLVRLIAQTPAYYHETLFTQLGQQLGRVKHEARIVILIACAQQPLGSQAAELFRHWALNDLLTSPEHLSTLLAIHQQCADDAGRSLNMWEYTLRTLEDLNPDPVVMARAYSQAAQIAINLDAKDIATTWLFEAARRGWDLNRSAALAQLQQAAETNHWHPDAAKAGWLLAYLQGQNRLVQPASPRPYDPVNFIDHQSPKLPLPEFNQTREPVVHTWQGWTLAGQDINKNLLAAMHPVASDDQAHAAGAIDEDDQTQWRPTVLPAAMIIPLTQQAAVDRIELQLDHPTHLAFTLLDLHGQPVARFERDWSFWDAYKNDDMWAQGRVTLKLPPVDGVAFLRLEIFNSLGKPAVNHLKLFPAAHRSAGWHVTQPLRIDEHMSELTLRLQTTQPVIDIAHQADSEAARAYPIHRWRDPWQRQKGVINLKQRGPGMAFVIQGNHLALKLQRTGGLDWQLDDNPVQHLDKTSPDSQTVTLVEHLPPGRHLFRLTSRPLPAQNDQWASDDIRIESVLTRAQASAQPAVRFSDDGKQWGPWLALNQSQENSQAQSVTAHQPMDRVYRFAVPRSPQGRRPAFAQTGIHLDARPTRNQLAPIVHAIEWLEPQTTQPPQALLQLQPWTAADLPRLSDQTQAVAQLLAQRKVVVTYPKVGSSQTHALASRLAQQARVYLVSDDVALNDYPGLVLAVGSPLAHRYTRQLLASHALWLDESYLRNEQGLVTLTRDAQGQPQTLYVMGETPEAIDAAADRLLDALRQQQAQSSPDITATPVRLFPASTLEMVYPWQLQPHRPALKELTLRLGLHDRRSMQFGLATNQAIDHLTFACSDLTDAQGRRIPADDVTLRVAANYEWIPFFGDLRLPNILSPQPVLPLPADAAIGLWLTVATHRATAPGVYRGVVTLHANGQRLQVPVTTTVEPIALTPSAATATYSFANIPYWFTSGSDAWTQAVRALADNEAAHGANHVSVGFDVTWQAAQHAQPHDYHLASSATADQMTETGTPQPWKLDGQNIRLQPGQAMVFRFSQPIAPWAIAVAVKEASVSKLTLEALDASGRWHDIATHDDFERQPWPVVLQTRASLTNAASTYRLVLDSPSAVTLLKITAFTDRRQDALFTCDFSNMITQMTICDEVYRQRGLPLPGFISQVRTESRSISRMLLGMYDDHQNICTRIMTGQLLEALERRHLKDRFMLKVGDEPSDLVAWAQMARPYHEAGLRTMTCHGVHYPDMSIAIGLINPWVPNYQHNIDLPFLRQRQAQGEPLWWYECGVPVTRLTGSPIENLPFYWLTAKWRLDGAMNYAAMGANRYSMPVPFRYEHGLDHRIVFESDGRVLDTTRRELESDGIADLKLMEYIRRRCAELPEAQARPIEQALETLLAQTVPYKYSYSQSPADWEAAREALYDLALQCAAPSQ